MQQGILLAADRQSQIVRMVEQQRSVRVAELAVLFGVTEETVRRDLDQLQSQGLLRRIHGGAITLHSGTGHETTFAEREGRNLEAKRAIASRAVKMVQEKDTLIIDASTTALHVARLLPDFEVTVVTNSPKVLSELSSRERVSVVVLGGMVRRNSLSLVGPLTERNLRHYRVDKAFLSCKGLTLDGIYESNEMEANLKKLMMEAADQVILLADSEKIEQTAFALINDLRGADVLITDAAAPPGFLRDVQDRGVEVIRA